MVADLHAHYPMRVVGDVTPATAVERLRAVRRRPTLADKARALALRIASTLFSHTDPFSGYRITVERLRAGGVGVAFSVLYRPGEELDPDERFASPPKARYFAALLEDLAAVEDEVAAQDDALLRVVRDRAQLDAALADGATALVHCVEGGFHLGADPAAIDRNVAELARRGVAYITVAHLFFRGVSTVAPALPFLSDGLYQAILRQPRGEGLTDVGAAVVRAMVRHRVLVDVSHMHADALDETLALLDEHDPGRTLPVISTHAGFRFGRQAYMHDAVTVRRIADRGGVIGLIMAQHQLLDGIGGRRPRDFAGSFEVLRRHIDRLAEAGGGHAHIALGTDFDGFVKPTMPGLEHMGDLRRLEDALRDHYGDEVAEGLTSGNALRVLRAVWA